MAVVAGLLVQDTLKYLLKFGTVSQYVGYNSVSDFFPGWSMKPNPQCDNQHCRLRQQKHQAYLASHPPPEDTPQTDQSDEVVHESNDWVDEPSNSDQVTEGVQFAYTLPQQSNQEDNDTALVADTGSMTVEQLAQQLKNL